MKSGIRIAGLVVLAGAIIGVGVYGCKKEELQKEDTSLTVSVEQEPTREYIPPRESIVEKPSREESSPKKPVSLEDKLYKQTKIAFTSERDENFDIYIMNADGSEQKRLTNSPAWDEMASCSGCKPFLFSCRK